jgi:hypothetical protein
MGEPIFVNSGKRCFMGSFQERGLFVRSEFDIASSAHMSPLPLTILWHESDGIRHGVSASHAAAAIRIVAHLRLGLARDEAFGMRPLIAHCHLGLGQLYRRTSKRERARERFTTATTLYREMDMRFWLEQAEAEIKGLAQEGSCSQRGFSLVSGQYLDEGEAAGGTGFQVVARVGLGAWRKPA